MSLWEERAGRNEALFREVNERVLELVPGGEEKRGSADFVCECSRDDCTERMPVPLAVYEAVRADPRRFLILPGHENDQFETVVERTAGYLIDREGGFGRSDRRAHAPAPVTIAARLVKPSQNHSAELFGPGVPGNK